MTVAVAFAGAGAGAIVGSFIATLCVRWPRGEQVISGRSACDSCKAKLGAAKLVPILSYAANRGRCRSCAAAIPATHVAVEIAAAVIGFVALSLSPAPAGVALALFGWLLLPSAVLDLRHFWLPDRLTLVLALAGLLLGGVVSGASPVDRIAGGLAGFAVLALIRELYRRFRGREGLGAGDPKLLGAIGCWLGWMALPLVLLIASAAGLAIALALCLDRTARLPFGTALALAGWVVAMAPLTGGKLV